MRTRLTVLLACCSLCLVGAADLVGQEANERHPAEATLQAYVAAFNASDAGAMTACWTETGVFANPHSGEEIAGRAALQAEFAALMQEHPGRSIATELGPMQLISPSVATQAGTAVVSGGEADDVTSEFDVVYVLVNGKWLIDRVSEQTVEVPPSHYEHLKVLEWMIGEWSGGAEAEHVSASCHWTRNNNFIVRTFSVGDETSGMSGIQLIGWDPAEQRIRSWAFDSDGGFAEGSWEQKDDRWLVTISATLHDGAKGGAVSVFRVLDENSFTWQRVNQVVDGQILPNVDEVVVTRLSSDVEE